MEDSVREVNAKLYHTRTYTLYTTDAMRLVTIYFTLALELKLCLS